MIASVLKWLFIVYNKRTLSKNFYNHNLEVDGLKEHLYELICEKLILKYDMDELGIDDVVMTEDGMDEL